LRNQILAFGPVPSRRLGQSLGVNNIPSKICSYSCIYCQIGRTLQYSRGRAEYHHPFHVFEEVQKKAGGVARDGGTIDYVTFVSDGEPTLDINLGREIDQIRELGIKVAVITNASLMGRADVREDLSCAELVSVKVDTVNEKLWRKVNRPVRDLSLDVIVEGILAFSECFNGELITETMLIKDVNDRIEEIRKLADFLSPIKHTKSYLSIPTRPPAENWVKPASAETLAAAYALFTERAVCTELLTGYEGNAFAFTGDVEQDILGITSVHPMKREAVEEYLKRAHADWRKIEHLIGEHKLIEVAYNGESFYMRNLR
jgi:wyosine [tRNA(Phe)-imidazoG37] synthetase (radical SAM superfamily)